MSAEIPGQLTKDEEALSAAHWVTASPHEWKWTHEQQVAMARYCVGASSRLALWDWLTEMRCMVQENSDVNGPRWCVLDVDGEILGGGATPLDAIRDAKSDEPQHSRTGLNGPPPRPLPPTTDRILEGETRPRKMQPIINCDCGFTIDCRNDRGREVECPQCGNQYLRKVSV
jgi:hypothetical protein